MNMSISVVSVLRFNPTAVSGKFTVIAPQPNSLRDDQGGTSQPGDVLSVQPDGSLQVRRVGTEGAFELCSRDGLLAVYQINGDGPITIIAPTGF
jgi:hypothetical protein